MSLNEGNAYQIELLLTLVHLGLFSHAVLSMMCLDEATEWIDD